MHRLGRRIALGIVSLALLLATPVTPGWCGKDWPQWGGPNRDFKVDTKGLADRWPDEGPPRLWSRELGEGYSTVISDGVSLSTSNSAPGAISPSATCLRYCGIRIRPCES